MLDRQSYTVAMVDTMQQRLNRCRTAKYDTMAAFCEAFGFHYGTYRTHEGVREFPWRVAQDYARALGVDPWWLLTGEKRFTAGTGGQIPIVSKIGAGDPLAPFENGPYDRLDFGSFAGMAAVAVEGGSMRPAYVPGDKIVFDPDDKRPPAMALHLDCVTLLTNGELYLKRVERGADGFDLISLNPDYPTMADAAIEWTSPVVAVIRHLG